MAYGPYGCFFDGKSPSNGDGGGGQNVGFFVERFSNQTISTGVETNLNIDTVIEENPAGVVDLVNDRFIAPVEGRYGFSLSADIVLAASGYAEVRLYVNGTLRTDSRDRNPFSGTVKPSTSFFFYLAQNDWVQPRIFQVTGFTATISGCQNQFSGALIWTP